MVHGLEEEKPTGIKKNVFWNNFPLFPGVILLECYSLWTNMGLMT